MSEDVGIIGGGPAGITAAIQLSRMGHSPIIFEGGRLGGLLNNANLVENYPGFPEGITGREMVGIFKTQLARFNVQVMDDTVSKVIPEDDRITLRTKSGDHSFKCVVVATGTSPLRLRLPGERELLGSKLFYEVSDLEDTPVEGQDIFIVGGGDAAFDYALNLEGKGANITIAFRSLAPTCIGLLHSRAMDKSRIHIIPTTTVTCFEPQGNRIVNKVICKDEVMDIDSDITLVAIGRTPNTEILPDGALRSDGRIPGLHLAGDVRRGDFRQVGIAVGDGLLAAMTVDGFLRGGDQR